MAPNVAVTDVFIRGCRWSIRGNGRPWEGTDVAWYCLPGLEDSANARFQNTEDDRVLRAVSWSAYPYQDAQVAVSGCIRWYGKYNIDSHYGAGVTDNAPGYTLTVWLRMS